MKKVSVLILTMLLFVSCASKKKHASLENGNDQILQLDLNTLVQLVMRDSYLESVQDLKHQADKIKEYNSQKKALRDELDIIKDRANARLEMMEYLVELKSFQNQLQLVLAEKTHEKYARTLTKTEASEIKREIKNSTEKLIKNMAYPYHSESPSIPNRVPRQGIKTLEDLNNELIEWSKKVGEDSQLQNLDLQNALQKQQQIFQMLTNIMKSLHDTQKAIINNIK